MNITTHKLGLIVAAGTLVVVGAGMELVSAATRVVLPHPELNLGLEPDPAKGYDIILNAPMGSPVMNETDIENLWKAWEPEHKAKAEAATPQERRQMTFQRYGWAKRLEPGAKLPLDYTRDGNGGLVANCFVCHGGKVMGKTIPGMGSAHVDLTTLATDVAKLRAIESGGDPATVKDVMAPFNTPLNFHRGVSNAVIFAHVFAGLRDPKVAAKLMQNPDLLKHHDVNAPAWWNMKKKERLYFDAFAPKTPRQLMPFAASPFHSEEKFRSFESNFVHIKAYIESLEPPKYPFEINQALAEKGRTLFEQTCSECHGTYGADWTYPDKVVPLDRIGTDPRRLEGVPTDRREASNAGWLQYYGLHPLSTESEGYIAPPLDGIWATAPYFHNGSVPTIHHVFNVDERPLVWKRDDAGYDQARVGLQVEEFDAVPEGLNSRERRMHYDTTHVGNSVAGHTFPDDELDAEGKRAVLEYLKTL